MSTGAQGSLSIEEIERMASEFRPAARSFLVVDPVAFERLMAWPLELKPGALNFHPVGSLYGLRVLQSPIWRGIAEPAPAPRELWRARLARRLCLVPWVVWATIVAAIELLCLLMGVRP